MPIASGKFCEEISSPIYAIAIDGKPAKHMPCINRTIKKVLKSVKNGWIKASKDTERTEKIIIGLRPNTSDMAPKNSMAKASVKVADDKAKLAFVSLTLKDFVK